MTVIVLERAPAQVRGKLNLYMTELKAGVFLGKLSSRTREMLWDMVLHNIEDGNGFLVWSTNKEAGYDVRTVGNTKWKFVDHDGLWLIQKPGRIPKDPL